MSARFRPFEPDDVRRLVLQPSQLVEAGIEARAVTWEDACDLRDRGVAWTACDGDWRVLCCAGIRPLFEGRHALAWAMLAADIGVAARLAITRFARARIAAARYARIECLIDDAPRDAGGRWATAVGMPREATLRAWGPKSVTIHVHARIGGDV